MHEIYAMEERVLLYLIRTLCTKTIALIAAETQNQVLCCLG